jgi:multiple sugar transport system substrate-binding protein
LNRRQFLSYGLGIAGAGIISLGLAGLASPGLLGEGVGPPSSSTTSSTVSSSVSSTQYSSLPDYQEFLSWLRSVASPYSGNSLDISLEAEFGPYATQLIDSDFTGATRVNDQYDIKPYSLQLQDISIMAETKSSSYDIYGLDVQNLGVFTDLPISPYTLAERYPDLTYLDPATDFPDFNRFAWDHIATYPPDLSGGAGGSSSSDVGVLPFDTPTLVLFYRTDIYQKLGLTPPTTWDEHFANSQAIVKSGLTPFGSVSMAGANVSIVYEYQAHLSDFGGSLWEVQGDTIIPSLNTDVALAALEDFIRFESFSDPGSSNYTWDDVFTSMAQEYAPHGLLFDGYSNWINDPQRSLVPGLIGYAKLPAGPKGALHPYAGSGIGVSQYSKNPAAAWLWVQWAVAKGTQEAKILGEYHNFPTRSSVVEAPEVADALQSAPFAIASLMSEIWQDNAITTLIGFPSWFAAGNIISEALNTAWAGTVAPGTALSNAQAKLEQLGTLTF